MFDNVRLNFVWAVIGKNTIGKTPLAILMAKAWQKKRPNSKLIAFDPQDKFYEAHKRKDLRVDVIIPQNNPNWAEELSRFEERVAGKKEYIYENSLVILDDFRMLCKNSNMPAYFLDLLALRPKTNMEFIIICHAPMHILEGLSYYVTDYSIFANEASNSSFEKKISCAVLCQKANLIVNKYVKLYGRGQYPFFPHIHVNKEQGELNFINMDYEKAKPLLNITDEIETQAA